MNKDKIFLIFLLFFFISTISSAGDFDLTEDGSIQDAINKGTAATKRQAEALESINESLDKSVRIVEESSKQIQPVMDELRRASNERGELKIKSQQNSVRIEKIEHVQADQQTMMEKLQTMMGVVIKNEDEQRNWVRGTFFIALAGILSFIGGVIVFIATLAVKSLMKNNRSSS